MKKVWKIGSGMALAIALPWAVPAAVAQQRSSWNEGINWQTDSRPAVSGTERATAPETGTARGGWLSERLTIGLGVRQTNLKDDYRTPSQSAGKTYLGFLNQLEMENEYQWFPVVTYWVARYLRVGASWESLKVKPYNYNPEDPYGPHVHSDGLAKLSGPVFMLEGLYPLFDDTLFPHVGAGVFLAKADFKEEAFWYYGYPDQEAYDEFGRPKKPRAGSRRVIKMDDTVGWLASAGLAWRPVRHLQVDFEVRQMWAESDCEFGFAKKSGWRRQTTGSFPFDNVTCMLSASYVF